MHLLVHLTTADYPSWKSAFDASPENLGLTLMQLWRDATDATRLTALFEVHDRKGAEDWLLRQRAHATAVDPHWLRTA